MRDGKRDLPYEDHLSFVFFVCFSPENDKKMRFLIIFEAFSMVYDKNHIDSIGNRAAN